MKVHHFGYLIKNMEQAINSFKELGYTAVSESVYDNNRKINICFLDNNGTMVELIEPVSEESTVSGLFKKIGVAPYHICYIVPDLDKAISELRIRRYIITAKAMEAPALENRRVAFMYNKNVGLIELLEEKKHE